MFVSAMLVCVCLLFFWFAAFCLKMVPTFCCCVCECRVLFLLLYFASLMMVCVDCAFFIALMS